MGGGIGSGSGRGVVESGRVMSDRESCGEKVGVVGGVPVVDIAGESGRVTGGVSEVDSVVVIVMISAVLDSVAVCIAGSGAGSMIGGSESVGGMWKV